MTTHERQYWRMRITPVFACALLLSLTLAGCSPAGPTDASGEPQVASNASGLYLPDVEALVETPVHWDSGILEVFDDVAALDTSIVPLRDSIEAHEKAWGEELFSGSQDPGDLSETGEPGHMEPSSLIVPGLRVPGEGPLFGPGLPHGAAGPGSVATTTAGQSTSLGASYMLGASSADIVAQGFVTEGWTSIPVGATATSGSGNRMTKIDEYNANVEVSNTHEEVKGDVTVRTEFRIKIEGTMCPKPDGDFDVRITVDQTVTATSPAGQSKEIQNLVVRAQGRLGEDAVPERYDVETEAATTQKTSDGRTFFARSTKTRSDLNFNEMDKGPSKVNRTSRNMTKEQEEALVRQGDSRAVALATGQMLALFKHWILGGCVQIKHDAPAKVDPDSTPEITIETPHRASKKPVKSNVTLEFSGEKSISKTEFKSPDTFQFTAGKEGEAGTIKVKATSRQGGDRQTITIKVEGEQAYQAIGGTDGYELTAADNAIVCEFETWGFTSPGYTPSNGYYWAFLNTGETTFEVIRGAGSYIRIREGSWALEKDKDDKPVAIVMTYENSFDVYQDCDIVDLGGGSGRFDLKPVPRPDWCDSMVTE